MSQRQRTTGSRLPHTVGFRSNIGSSEIMEEQNEVAENKLCGNVRELKSLSIKISDEVKEHSRLLNKADNTFDNVDGLLGSTLRKMTHLRKSGHRYYLLYIFPFCLFVFFIIWYII